MTKRYKIEYYEDLLEISSIIDTVENHELTAEEIVDLLNENEQLKAYKQKVAKAFKIAIKETTLTEQTENSLRAISKILEVDLE